jgi:isoamylase
VSLRRHTFFTGRMNRRGQMDIRWHGLDLDQPDWGGGSRTLAFTFAGEDPLEPDLHVMMNMDDNPHAFAVPQDGKDWLVFADTGKASPDDITDLGAERPFEGERCDVEGRSIVILVSEES